MSFLRSILLLAVFGLMPLGAMAASGGGPAVSPAAPVVTWIGEEGKGIPITNAMIYTWIIAAVIFLIVKLGTSRLEMVPRGLQNAIEATVEGLENVMSGLLEPKVVRWVYPLIATYFLFILFSNLMGLLPGVGSIGYGHAKPGLPFAVDHADVPLFRPPTADANTTIAMSLIFFVMSTWWAIKYNGIVGLTKHIFGVKGGMTGFIVIPLTIIFLGVGLIEVISILIRPVALAMRLYGNIYGGESVLTIMLALIPGGFAAIPFYFLELIVALVQALVFTLLCIAFVGTLCSHTEEEGKGHGHGDEGHAH